MKLLLTGFDPFGQETLNPSYEAIKLLPDRMGSACIEKVLLPVSFENSGAVLKDAINACQPDAVICVGQAGGYAGLAIERIAINLRDASIPDNDGNQPQDQPVVSGGPAAYFSTLPVKDIVSALKANHIPAFISNSAGTYVCNNVMYTLLHEIHSSHLSIPGGFIHVPYTTAQASQKSPVPPSMDLKQIAKGLKTAVETTVASLKAEN